MVSYMFFVFCVFPGCYCLVVSTSAIDCLKTLVSEITSCVEWDVKKVPSQTDGHAAGSVYRVESMQELI